jgi:hypothetical protein
MALTKKAALAALLDRLRAHLDEVGAAQKATAEGATHEESRAENDKDTRALEATYLARGLAERVDDLREAVTRMKNLSDAPITGDGPVSVPALVTLEDEDGGRVRYLLAPVGGGHRAEGRRRGHQGDHAIGPRRQGAQGPTRGRRRGGNAPQGQARVRR